MRMALVKRIFLFLLLNVLVCTTISVLLAVFKVQPYLTAFGLSVSSLMCYCLIWGMGGALVSLALSRVMARWLMGVQLLDLDTRDPQARELIDLVRSLTQEAGLPMPQIGIFRSNEVNAFATGPSKRRSLVAVSTGLLQRMNTNQMKGVLGHELSHIANGDMVTMTLLQGVVNAFVLFLSRLLAFAVSGMLRNRENRSNNPATFAMLSIVFQVLFMILGALVVSAFSRWREFRADAGGADLAGKDSMVAALRGLQALQDIRDQRHEKPAFQALGISSQHRSFLSLFATHPPLEQRIRRLEQSM
jgi:heat shock protein HtpX